MQKDLFEFFQDNESKLHERPSEQVWLKLERRLERKRRRRRNRLFMQLGAVGVALLILLLAGWAVVHFAK